MKKLVILAVVALGLAASSPASAWTWPVNGEVVRAYSFGTDPYASGQHRGIDIASPSGTDVRAPASGVVTFRGTVPSGGMTLTITTPDGYAVTLQQLGATAVTKGAAVSEGTIVASVGASSDPVTVRAHVHMGVRLASNRQGYLDPLSFLGPGSSGAVLAPPEGGSADTPAEAEPAPEAQPIAEPDAVTEPIVEPEPIAEPGSVPIVEVEPLPLDQVEPVAPPVHTERPGPPRPTVEPPSASIPDPIVQQPPVLQPAPPTGVSGSGPGSGVSGGSEPATVRPAPPIEPIESADPVERVEPVEQVEPIEPVESQAAPPPVEQPSRAPSDPVGVDTVAAGSGPTVRPGRAVGSSEVGRPAVSRAAARTARPVGDPQAADQGSAPARPAAVVRRTPSTQPVRSATGSERRAAPSPPRGSRTERARAEWVDANVVSRAASEPTTAVAAASVTAALRSQDAIRSKQGLATEPVGIPQHALAPASSESDGFSLVAGLLLVAFGALGLAAAVWHWRRSTRSQIPITTVTTTPANVMTRALPPKAPRCHVRGAPHGRGAGESTRTRAMRRSARRSREHSRFGPPSQR